MTSRTDLRDVPNLLSTPPGRLSIYDWGSARPPTKFKRAIDKCDLSLGAVRSLKSHHPVSFRDGMVARLIKSA
jgi:hypothetical protein